MYDLCISPCMPVSSYLMVCVCVYIFLAVCIQCEGCCRQGRNGLRRLGQARENCCVPLSGQNIGGQKISTVSHLKNLCLCHVRRTGVVSVSVVRYYYTHCPQTRIYMRHQTWLSANMFVKSLYNTCNGQLGCPIRPRPLLPDEQRPFKFRHHL